MPHSAGKKSTKKKTATPSARRSTKHSTESNEFDDWAESQKTRPGCTTCRQPGVRDTIQSLLESLIRARAYKFSIHEMRGILNKKHPEAEVGQRGLERHLRTCERALYFKARGRRNV